jgi:hypothetical protein
MPTKKDHDLLDARYAALAAIKQELARYNRRMNEVAMKVVDERFALAYQNGESINAEEIGTAAAAVAKADYGMYCRQAIEAPQPRRISKR